MSNLKLPTMTHKNLRAMMGKRSSLKLAYATEAHAEHGSDVITITQHGNTIAILTPDTVTIDNCGYATTTTATRLRKILSDNGIDYYVRIKNFSMRLYNSHHTELDPDFRSLEFVNIGYWAPNWEKLSNAGAEIPQPKSDTPAQPVRRLSYHHRPLP